ncbi:MAG: ATP-binding cassette domain-containing protein, partial [Clostridia bacterium]|nr:ATP-binding cassette domain-containing protein [Clostridia bacterium]
HNSEAGESVIEVRNLRVLSDRGIEAVRGVNLDVRAGEILGVAAIEGNGQSELVEAITGMRPMRAGDITICNKRASGLTPGEIRSLGLSHVPEDRISTGICLAGTVSDNLIAGKHISPTFSRGGTVIIKRAVAEYARRLFDKFDIRAAGVDIPADSLSGGNMQKVVIAREFSFDSKALIISQPTRGVDIGAMEFIHKLIIDKRDAGCAILLVSADLDEIFRLSDRVVTMFEGRTTGEFKAGSIAKEDIGFYMTGARSSMESEAVM